MKKRMLLFASLLAAVQILAGCASVAPAAPAQSQPAEKQEEVKEEKQEEAVGMANPWTECSREEVLDKIGFDMQAPADASDVHYMINESIEMAEMDFTMMDQEFTYRMQPTDAFEDISGLYYEWDVEDEVQVGWCEGISRRAIGEEETVDNCLWYDVVPGIMYSLSTSAKDLDGFDILAVVDMVYQPVGDYAEEFMPGNFFEAMQGRDTFDSYDEIIDLLEPGNAYAKAKVYGWDGDILFISEQTYDYGGGVQAAIDASAYIEVDGKARSAGNVFSEGTAYPVSLDKDGKIYTGGNHEVNVYAIGPYNSIMVMVYAHESFDTTEGNPTYSGFVRETNTYDGPEYEIAEDDDSVLPKLYEEYANTELIAFTVK